MKNCQMCKLGRRREELIMLSFCVTRARITGEDVDALLVADAAGHYHLTQPKTKRAHRLHSAQPTPRNL